MDTTNKRSSSSSSSIITHNHKNNKNKNDKLHRFECPRKRRGIPRRESALHDFLLVVSLLVLAPLAVQVHGLVDKPIDEGGSYTADGYDSTAGAEPICWSARPYQNETLTNSSSSNAEGMTFSNGLVPDFLAGAMTRLYACPNGTDLRVDPPAAYVNGDILRAGQSYHYLITATIDLDQIREHFGLAADAYFFSEDGSMGIEATISFCPTDGTFCTPFTYDILKSVQQSMNSSGSNSTSSTLGVNRTLIVDHSNRKKSAQESMDNIFETRKMERGVNQNSAENNGSGNTGGNRRRLRLRGLAINDQEESNLDHYEYTITENSIDDDIVVDGMIAHREKDNTDNEDHKNLSSSVYLVTTDPTQTKFVIHVDNHVTVHVPGTYIPLASLLFFLANNSDVQLKFDMANVLQHAALEFEPPPEIREVQSASEIIAYVLIGLTGMIQLLLLGLSIVHRDNPIMKLSQGRFLIIAQCASLISTPSAALFSPSSETYCILQYPMTLIPTQFVLAIVFSRLLRINTIMGSLMNWSTVKTKKERKANVRQWIAAQWSRSSTSSCDQASASQPPSHGSSEGGHGKTLFKRKFTKTKVRKLKKNFSVIQLWISIVAVTMPQVIVQIIGLVLFSPDLWIDLNSSQSIGRYECGTASDQYFTFVGAAVAFCAMFACMWQGRISSKLPSLFNEASSVIAGLITTLFVSTFSFAVIIVSNDPESPPDVPFLMHVIIFLNFNLNMMVRLILPKLRLIWSGEKIIVSKIMSEHRKKKHDKVKRQEEDSVLLDMANRKMTTSINGREEKTEGDEQLVEGNRNNGMAEGVKRNETISELSCWKEGPVEGRANYSIGLNDSTTENEQIAYDRAEALGTTTMRSKREGRRSFVAAPVKNSSISRHSVNSNSTDRTPLVIEEGCSPPSELIAAIAVLSTDVSRIYGRVLSGMQVSQEEWLQLQQELEESTSLMQKVVYS